jgi:ketosteroid isomerase-like protein
MNPDLIDLVRQYFAAIEAGNADRFFAPGIIQEEFPNRLIPNGATRNLAALREAAEQGRHVLVSQRIELINGVASGSQVAVEARWSATLAVPIANTPAGGVMRARFAIFIEFRDGLIIRQRNYDCFEPF